MLIKDNAVDHSSGFDRCRLQQFGWLVLPTRSRNGRPGADPNRRKRLIVGFAFEKDPGLAQNRSGFTVLPPPFQELSFDIFLDQPE
jgi:hypothetical protein